MQPRRSARREGFEVIEARNAEEAPQIMEGRSDVRVLFTDVHMPGPMNGIDLALLVRDRWPAVNIILTSGQADLANAEIPERGLHFRKPCSLGEVVSAISGFFTSTGETLAARGRTCDGHPRNHD